MRIRTRRMLPPYEVGLEFDASDLLAVAVSFVAGVAYVITGGTLFFLMSMLAGARASVGTKPVLFGIPGEDGDEDDDP